MSEWLNYLHCDLEPLRIRPVHRGHLRHNPRVSVDREVPAVLGWDPGGEGVPDRSSQCVLVVGVQFLWQYAQAAGDQTAHDLRGNEVGA